MYRFNSVFRNVRLWITLACLGLIALLVFQYQQQKLASTSFFPRPYDTNNRQVPENTKDRPHSEVDERKAPLGTNTVTVRKIQTKPPPPPKPTTKTKTKTTTTTTAKPKTNKDPTVTIVQVPDTPTLKRMSHLELHKFYHSYINSPQVPCSAVERMGKLQDGGWEMCDDPLYRPDKKNCLVYSFGINYDFSYDDDIAEYGCEVYAFDPSMINTGNHIRGEKVHFFRLGIGDRDNFTLQEKNGLWTLYSLKGLRERFGHKIGQRRIDIVKIDVEGHEMESLTQALKDKNLDDVRQLSFETHVTWSTSDATKEQYIKFLELLRGVYDAGFRIYTTHRNHVWSAFKSQLTGKERAHCHEIHTVNINLRQKPSRESLSRDNLLSGRENAPLQLHDQVRRLSENAVLLAQNQGIPLSMENAPQSPNQDDPLPNRIEPLNPMQGNAMVKTLAPPPAKPIHQVVAGPPSNEDIKMVQDFSQNAIH